MDMRSISGYCTCVWGNLVTRSSKKQTVAARSVETEHQVLVHGTCEGMWLKRLLGELKLEDGQLLKVLCDNQSVISTAKNPFYHDRTKHIEVDRQ